MRTWVCRARFAADRVFAIDRMKKSSHVTRIANFVNRELERCETASGWGHPERYGKNLVRQAPMRVNLRARDQDRAGSLVVRENQSRRDLTKVEAQYEVLG
jgi:hypothetical protein